jgi:hypothetical protein
LPRASDALHCCKAAVMSNCFVATKQYESTPDTDPSWISTLFR